jgi:hypothetical protein
MGQVFAGAGKYFASKRWMVVSCMLLLPAPGHAQHAGAAGMRVAGGQVAMTRPVAATRAAGNAQRVVVRANGLRPGSTVARRVRAGSAPLHGTSSSARLNNLQAFSTDMNVPGLGFDYPHLAAVNSGRSRRRTGFAPGGSFGFGGGFGGFLLSPEIIVENPQAVEEAQQTAEEQGGAPNVVADEREAQREYFPRTGTAPAPVKDQSQYVFVRRDGGLLFAVAYSWENGTLRYVTPEGLRKSVTQESLDMDATQQFNEQRGLSFRVPA